MQLQQNQQQQQHQQQQRYQFEIDEKSGELWLRAPLDFESQSEHVLTVSARDRDGTSDSSRVSYATVRIGVLDVNDHAPDISVTFLNSLAHNASTAGFRRDLYMNENARANQFIAHVTITDKDANSNSQQPQLDWQVLVNERVHFASSPPSSKATQSPLRLIKLSNNSFTLNVAAGDSFDRERNTHFNVTVVAWDHGTPALPATAYAFRIRLVDQNDNAPVFERPAYTASVLENNQAHALLVQVRATDADAADSANSRLTYSMLVAPSSASASPSIGELLYVEPESGCVRARLALDRERDGDTLHFEIVATDGGGGGGGGGAGKPLSARVPVTLHIVDTNDNRPSVAFNTSLRHRVTLNASGHTSYDLHVRVGRAQALAISSSLVQFSGVDADAGDNGRTRFSLMSVSNVSSLFRLGADDGRFGLASRDPILVAQALTVGTILSFRVVCSDLAIENNSSSSSKRLSSSVGLRVQIVASDDEYCVQRVSGVGQEEVFINRDAPPSPTTPLFGHLDYQLANNMSEEASPSPPPTAAHCELLTHLDLVELKWWPLTKSAMIRLEIRLRDSNTSSLALGKYTLRVRVSRGQCAIVEQFHLLVGNSVVGREQLVLYLRRNSQQQKLLHHSYESDDDEHKQQMSRIEKALVSSSAEESVANKLTSRKLAAITSTTTSLMKSSDYVLLLVFVAIMLVTSVLFVVIVLMCVCSKHASLSGSGSGSGSSAKRKKNKKQKSTAEPAPTPHDAKKSNKKKTNTPAAAAAVDTSANLSVMDDEHEDDIDLDDDDDDEHDDGSDRFLSLSMKKKKPTKTKKAHELHDTLSSSSSSSLTNSDMIAANHKPQYTLVHHHNKSSTATSTTSSGHHHHQPMVCTTTLYRFSDKDDRRGGGGGGAAKGLIIKEDQPQPRPLYQATAAANKMRLIYTPKPTGHIITTNNNNNNSTSISNGYESQRSHSAAESFVIDDHLLTSSSSSSSSSSSASHSNRSSNNAQQLQSLLQAAAAVAASTRVAHMAHSDESSAYSSDKSSSDIMNVVDSSMVDHRQHYTAMPRHQLVAPADEAMMRSFKKTTPPPPPPPPISSSNATSRCASMTDDSTKTRRPKLSHTSFNV